jgi:hypothetical protein
MAGFPWSLAYTKVEIYSTMRHNAEAVLFTVI